MHVTCRVSLQKSAVLENRPSVSQIKISLDNYSILGLCMLCTLKYAANLQERGTDMKKKLKQFKKYSSVTVMALLLSTMIYTTPVMATSAEFNQNTRVDSNSWTKMASPKKSTSNHYAAIYLRDMMDIHHNSNNNYEQLYARMSYNQTTVIDRKMSGAGSYEGGKALLKRGKKTCFLLKQRYCSKNQQINIFLEGHNPKYDCYVSGSWNIDRANSKVD